MSINKVILIGNAGADPELKTIGNGNKVTNFSLATSESWKDKVTGEKKVTTDWHNVTAWNGLADILCKYVKKGSKLYIEGKLKTRSYEDQHGNKKYITEILAEEIRLLGEKPQAAQEPIHEVSGRELRSASVDTDDLPF